MGQGLAIFYGPWGSLSGLWIRIRIFKKSSNTGLTFIFILLPKIRFSYQYISTKVGSVFLFFWELDQDQDPISLDNWFRFRFRVGSGSTTLLFYGNIWEKHKYKTCRTATSYLKSFFKSQVPHFHLLCPFTHSLPQ